MAVTEQFIARPAHEERAARAKVNRGQPLPYDFRQPRLFAQDQMRMLSHVHDRFARDFAVYLSAQLRTIVDISVARVEQMLYSEYVLTSQAPAALYVVKARHIEQELVVEVDPRFVIFVVEKMFGGPGMELGSVREISHIEQGIMGKVMRKAFYELGEAWKRLYEVEFKASAFESNAEFIQITSGAAPVFVVTFEVGVYEQKAFLSICYPYLLLERLLGRWSMKQWASSATKPVPPAVRERYQEALRGIEVEMGVELGRAKLSVQELLQLEEGDVVLLQQPINEPVRVVVDGQKKFLAAPGKSGERRAIRILEVLEPVDPSDDESF